MKTHDEWKKAIINIECVTSIRPNKDIMSDMRYLHERLRNKQIDVEEYANKHGELIAQQAGRRFTGSAIFLEYCGARYLITARHVLFDRFSELTNSDLVTDIDCKPEHRIYERILFVPSYDNYFKREFIGSAIVNLSSIPYEIASYSFSSLELDLAIISLDTCQPHSADKLIEVGYEPIFIDDIADEPSNECVDVMAIGYPGATSRLGNATFLPEFKFFYSDHYSLPVTSFGKVSMLHKELPYFWADISIYPGNSGGPVIENGCLVGIVSSNALIPSENQLDSTKSRIPFGRMIKSRFIIELLDEQVRKDNLRISLMNEMEKHIEYHDDKEWFEQRRQLLINREKREDEGIQ